MKPFPPVIKRLNEWLICGRCGVSVAASIGSLSDAERDPLVGLARNEETGVPVLVHKSCMKKSAPGQTPLVVDVRGGNSELFGYNVEDLQTERMAPVAVDHRTVVTYCAPARFVVSLSAAGRLTSHAVLAHVYAEFADPCVYSWLSVYTAPDDEVRAAAMKDGQRLWPYKTDAFNRPGDTDPMTVFVHYSHFPRSEPHKQTVPPVPPVRGMDLVYSRCSIHVHASGREVCVGAHRLVPTETHAFFVGCTDSDAPPLLFARRAVNAAAGVQKPRNAGAVVPLVFVSVPMEVGEMTDGPRADYIRGFLGYTIAPLVRA
jgi:hypothetical protein